MLITEAQAIAAYTTAVMGEQPEEAAQYGGSFHAAQKGAFIWDILVIDALGDNAHGVVMVQVPSTGRLSVRVFADGILYDGRTPEQIEQEPPFRQ